MIETARDTLSQLTYSMFYVSGDITIRSRFGFQETASIVADALGIPPFREDKSGRWEEVTVLVSQSLGLQFALGLLQKAQAEGEASEYGMSLRSRVVHADYDGDEKEVDATAYIVWLLKGTQSIEVSPG